MPWPQAMADGRIDKKELEDQEERLVTLMKKVEPELNDRLHGRGLHRIRDEHRRDGCAGERSRAVGCGRLRRSGGRSREAADASQGFDEVVEERVAGGEA